MRSFATSQLKYHHYFHEKKSRALTMIVCFEGLAFNGNVLNVSYVAFFYVFESERAVFRKLLLFISSLRE